MSQSFVKGRQNEPPLPNYQDAYPSNSTAKVYRDIDDNPVTLSQLIDLHPEWAYSRIKVLEEAHEYANRLAMHLWLEHYSDGKDETEIEILPDLPGVLSQIDNMICGLDKP